MTGVQTCALPIYAFFEAVRRAQVEGDVPVARDARVLARYLTCSLNGLLVLAKANPDGYTLMMSSAGILSINQFLYASMPFDPDKAFTPISLVADAGAPDTWWDGRAFDRILLDAPCSATGVIRRHPDIKLHRGPAEVGRLREQQAALLAGVWPLLASGGKLLYATCSMLAGENQLQMQEFLAKHADAAPRAVPLPFAWARGPGMQILPGQEGMDGFYYACLQKR